MKFYRSSTVEFSNSAPKCQDAFRSLFPKVIPSSVHISIRQHTGMDTVTRECVQILSYVNWFMKAIGKTSTSMENLLQQGGSEFFRDSDKLLSDLQMQSACLNSLDKALESVTDLSIALACNLQLARRDSILKVCASHLQEHDFNKLRRTGFKSADLFCPTTLDQIQKKQDRSPKRLKGDSRQSFQLLWPAIYSLLGGIPSLKSVHHTCKSMILTSCEGQGSSLRIYFVPQPLTKFRRSRTALPRD